MAATLVAFGPLLPESACQAVRVRPAVERDRERLLELLRAYLEEAGGDVLPCPENIELYGQIFDRYVSGEAEGAALLAVSGGRPVGFTLAGEFPMGFRTRHGKAAMGWATYVVPEERRKGHARRLRKALDNRLRALGFDTVLGGYAPGNGPAQASIRGTGFEVYQVLGAKRLREE